MAKLVWFGLISVASSQVPRASARESEHERAKRCFIWCSFHKITLQLNRFYHHAMPNPSWGIHSFTKIDRLMPKLTLEKSINSYAIVRRLAMESRSFGTSSGQWLRMLFSCKIPVHALLCCKLNVS